jgi:hypothetical protein
MAFIQTSALMEILNYNNSGGGIYMTNGKGTITTTLTPTLNSIVVSGNVTSSTLTVSGNNITFGGGSSIVDDGSGQITLLPAVGKYIVANTSGSGYFTVTGGNGISVNTIAAIANGAFSLRSGTGSYTTGQLNFFSWPASAAGNVGASFTSTNTATSGTSVGLQIVPTWNQTSGTAGNTDLLVNRVDTQHGSGPQYLIDLQINNASQFHVDSAGGTLINGALVVNSNLTAVNVYTTSDFRYKDVIGSYTRGLDDVLKLSPKNFTWNEYSKLDRETINTGFIAQDVLSIIPEAVHKDGNGFYSISDRPIIAALVNAVKELSAEINTLKNNLID